MVTRDFCGGERYFPALPPSPRDAKNSIRLNKVFMLWIVHHFCSSRTGIQQVVVCSNALIALYISCRRQAGYFFFVSPRSEKFASFFRACVPFVCSHNYYDGIESYNPLIDLVGRNFCNGVNMIRKKIL